MSKNKTRQYLEVAATIAVLKNDIRDFRLGAIAIRNDGAIVSAYNSPSETPKKQAHCEARLARKLDHGAVVYLARVTRKDGSWGMSRPCATCQRALKRRQVKKVYYTIGPNEWGVMHL